MFDWRLLAKIVFLEKVWLIPPEYILDGIIREIIRFASGMYDHIGVHMHHALLKR